MTRKSSNSSNRTSSHTLAFRYHLCLIMQLTFHISSFMFFHYIMALFLNTHVTTTHSEMVSQNPKIKIVSALSRRPFTLNSETGTPLWWMLYGLTESHLSLLWIPPPTSLYMEKNPSSCQTCTCLFSSFPKNPKAIRVCYFSIGWTHFTSYRKKGRKKKKNLHSTRTVSRNGSIESLSGVLASVWVT